tara:strand:+ start:42 stop:524 length:483 start_codon:yes stop_codon:yes gene_type:complete
MTIKIENNFLRNSSFWKICKTVSSENFPWYIDGKYNDLIHTLIDTSNKKPVSSFYANEILSPLVSQLNCKQINYAKLILNFCSSKIIEQAAPKHEIDINDKNYKGLLCINTNNSEIQIIGTNKVSSVENRFMSFPKNTPYFATTHTDKRCRILLEIIYNA